MVTIARWIAMLLATVATVVLIGWAVELEVVKAPVPGTRAMVPNTAIMFLLSCLALALLSRPGARRRTAGRAAAGAVVVIASAFLAEYLLGRDLAIDRLIADVEPSRPAPETALTFLLLGLALTVVDRAPRRGPAPAELLALAGALVPLVVSVGYAYGHPYFFTAFPIGMAVHTAAGSLALGAAILMIRPDRGIMRILSSPYLGGMSTRRMLLVAVVTVPIAGAIAVQLQDVGVLPSPGAAVVAAAFSFAVFVGALLVGGHALDQADLALRKTAIELERERARLESVLVQMPEGVIVLGADGEPAYENPAARVYRAVEGAPQPYDVRWPSGEPVPVPELPLARAFATGETVTGVELEVQTGSGDRIPILASAAPIRHGEERVGAVTVFRDVRVLKDLEQLRREWTSVVAHDLRQPLNAMRLTAELLMRTGSPDQVARSARRCQREVLRLDAMIGDLLDASLVESRRIVLQRRPISPRELVEAALARAPDVAPRCRIEVDDAAPPLFADEARLLQVLGNLLSNAVKYGEAGTPIKVTVTRDGDAARITVTNHGAGIPPEELPGLFNRFVRTSAARHGPVEGIGLGLYICHGLVESHGGRIWAESTPGATTSFHLTIPFAVPGTLGATDDPHVDRRAVRPGIAGA